MQKIIYALLSISVITTTLLFCVGVFDNTDHRTWSENMKDGQTVVVKSSRRFLEEDNLKTNKLNLELQMHEQQALEAMQGLLTKTTNLCLGGQIPSKMTLEEHVSAFNAGPCDPVILVPGLAATSLQVQIDCLTLQQQRPDVFQSCGWSTCSSYEFWKKKPDSEYRLWISGVNSPMGIIMTSKKDHCFGDVFQLIYDPSHPDPSKRYSDVAGMKVTYFGNTPQTEHLKQCGLGAVSQLTDDALIKMISCDHKGYLNIGNLLKNMGYISGLLFQAIPYDYRRDIKSSSAPSLITQSVENLHKITGKKVLLIAHSLGSLYTMHTMNMSPQEWKDKYVSSIITFGAPYLGTSKAIRSNLGGDPGYLSHYLGVDVGMNYYCQNKAINTGSSGMDLYPRDTFNIFQNETWMQELMARIKYERNYQDGFPMDKKAIPMDWFPSPNKNCTTGFSTRTNECLTHVTDLTHAQIIIDGKEFSSSRSDINSMLESHSVNKTLLQQYFQESQLEHLEQLTHPGVPIIIVYGSFMEVEDKFSYDKSPLEVITQTNDFYFPENVSTAVGDGTVITASAITPAIKWIYEHKNKVIPYPTKLVEFCSTFQNDQSIYDEILEDGTKLIKKSGYLGVECECLNNKKEVSNCKHSCMINDKYLVDLVSTVIQSNSKSIYLDHKSPLNEEELNQFIAQCKNIMDFESDKNPIF